ncbi:hypothetical protein EDD17DRAFT_1643426 [Pisolithus thermaeus]|nr:hypothetical protein EDD17DRAFT_1643426 [Pisolithus thermaeus]
MRAAFAISYTLLIIVQAVWAAPHPVPQINAPSDRRAPTFGPGPECRQLVSLHFGARGLLGVYGHLKEKGWCTTYG